MPSEGVIDTVVLQSANAEITKEPKGGNEFRRRLSVLDDVRSGALLVLFSPRLLDEYDKHIKPPRNDFIREFLELLTRPGFAIANWKKDWKPARLALRKCRYPKHDDHLVRTAMRPSPTTIITEEEKLQKVAECVYRSVRVKIVGLPARPFAGKVLPE